MKNWILGISIGISIILSVIAICMHMSEVTITDTSLVLGFVGVMATFLVVSNATQMWKMEHKIEQYNQLLTDEKKNLKIVSTATQHTIFTFARQEMKKTPPAVDEAFLYLLDVIPILPYLYGESGDECADDGCSLRDYSEKLKKFINYKGDNKVREKDLLTCKKLIKRLPSTYSQKMYDIEILIDNLIK